MTSHALEIRPGTQIGAWKVNDLLGRGGQGSVWSAKPVKVKHTPSRALKVCCAIDEQSRLRFVREVELLRRCESPHVLKVYDQDLEWKEHVADAPTFAYFVSEKCKGSLEQRQKDLGDARRRLAIFRQACAAVMHLHGMDDPVLHRDIKPANFLIAQELDNVVLADFGIAWSLAASALTEVFEVVGTPYYRAPEITNGERGTIQSDVYCMGRLLEWLLTDDVSRNMATRPVPRGGDLDDEACDILDRIIAKATQVTAANRFASIKELADQLPDLWLSVKPRPSTTSVVSSTDAAVVLPIAFEIARKNDQLGWRQLETHLRRDLVDGLLKWRADNEPARVGDRNKDTAFLTADKLLDVVSGRLVFALAGVYSGNPALADQRRVIDDFVTIPGWSQGGTTAIVEGPRAILYVLHYLHGALCLHYGQLDLALQFIEVPVPSARRNEVSSLWHHRDITRWPKLLGGNVSWAWEFLRGLWNRRPVLQQLFALPSDFELGLASYSIVLSLLELAAQASPGARSNPETNMIDVPPLFIGMDRDTIATAARRTIENRAVVERIAERTGATIATMQERWTQWKTSLRQFRSEGFGQWDGYEELPLGKLAGR